MKMNTLLKNKSLSFAVIFGILQVPAWIFFSPKAVLASGPQVVAEDVPADLNIFAKLAKQTVPSVVNLSVVSTVQTDYNEMNAEINADVLNDFFGQYGHPPGMRRLPPHARKEVALGTGFIIDPSGVILTNNHVVAHADQVEIQLTESADDKPIQGKVIGRDPDLDVALIRFTPPRKLTALTLGNSDAIDVGEFVMAVGNPYGQGHSVTHGIVSAKGRQAPDVPMANYLQTDAPINPGNSGGPLLNLKGEVIGINNAIDARAQGISFAIPINVVKSILPQLESSGKVSRGFIGAAIGPMTPEIAEKIGEAKDLRAPIVTDITLGGPAAKAGIRPYDVILEAGSTAVHTPTELILAVTATQVGNKLPLTILRSGKKMKIQVQVDQRPNLQKVSQR